jgi:hypothetical protein
MRTPMRRQPWLIAASGMVLLVVALALAWQLPFVQDHLGWRISELKASIKYAISPPEEAAFTPNPSLAAMVQSTLAALTPTATATTTPGPTAVPSTTPTPTIEPTPLPAKVELTGIIHEYQKWNNCGPANLAMALSFWGWQGDQRPVAAYVKPNPRDKNVMPYELVDFVNTQTDFKALVRVGGDLDRLKSLLAAGFPVIVEKGFEGPGFPGWMGHYEVVSGYDDSRQRFTVQDSYIMPNLPVSYDDMQTYWRHFNYTYLVIYPPGRQSELMQILGPDADEITNFQRAAQKASDEIYASTGRQQFFAWFNRGSSLVDLKDYTGAAAAYDQAFTLQAQIAQTDPQANPWRILWYQTGPYFAYFYTGRTADVINLATQTLSAMSEPILEESYYWRGLARESAGDLAGAIDDWRTALQDHPDWAPALQQLQRVGASPS